jgi:hypothetical protein
VSAVNVFEDDDYYTGPPLDDDMVRRAEEVLGVSLPRAYVDVLRQRNGGTLVRGCIPTDFPNSWAEDHVEINAILGIGGEWGVESKSPYWIREWRYPDVGVVIAMLPSGGHDTVMLDYSKSGPHGEPGVVYVDEARVPRPIADSFDDFLARLVSCDTFADD